MSAPGIPTLDVVDASGRRRRVHPASEHDTVVHLASALGYRQGFATTIAGRVVAPGCLLRSIDDLLEGVQVGFEDPTSTSTQPDETVRPDFHDAVELEFAVVTGPSCRGWAPLPVGRHGVGRSSHATVRLADDLVEIHHAIIDVEPDGSIAVTQLTGRVPLTLVRLATADALTVGLSRIEIRRRDRGGGGQPRGTAMITPIAGDPWHLEVRRGPPSVRPEPLERIPPPIVEPTVDMPSGTALVGAVVAVAGALVIAGLLRQTMFAVFALVGAFASASTWGVAALGVRRRRRRARRASVLDRHRFATDLRDRHLSMLDEHRRRHPDVIDALADLFGDRSGIWHRRLDPSTDGAADGVIDVVIGRGTQRIDPMVDRSAGAGEPTEVLARIEETSILRDVPIPIRLAPAEAIAIRGDTDRVRPLLRSILVQASAWLGPSDLRVIVIGDPDAWNWVGWLPHARARCVRVSVLAPTDVDRLGELTHEMARSGPGTSATVLVVDDPTLLGVRTGPVRRFMAATGATTVVAVDAASNVPTVCRRTLALSPSGSAAWVDERDVSTFEQVCVAGLDEATAWNAARALAPLVDPEDDDHERSQLPDGLTLASLDSVATPSGVDDVVARWTAEGVDPALRAPIGASADGIVEIDLVADGPHALVAGTTGSGKSELLRTLVVSLASRVSPVHLNFVLIDYKGGATFDSCVDLPHTVGMVTDLDDGLAERALVSLDAELDRRERLLRSVRAGDLDEYRARPGREPIARLVVIVDEFATLAHELPDFLAALVSIAQRGRSLGVHVILATQRPAGVVTDDIRANTDLRVALRVSDPAEARDVVGDDLPSMFAKSAPGRAMLRLAGDERIVFQAARCTGPVLRRAGQLRVTDPCEGAATPMPPGTSAAMSTELDSAVDSIRRAAAALSLPSPRRPWLEPLPRALEQSAVDAVVREARSAVHQPGARRGADDDGDDGDGWDDGDDVATHDAIGVIDDPRNQRRLPLRWDRTFGNLVIYGALGSGRTSAIVSLVAALCRTASPERRHVYVIDALGDRTLDGLATVAHCGGVVRVAECERIDRLLRRLTAEIELRSAMTHGVGALPDIVLLVDGLGELRRSLDTLERGPSLAMLDRILGAGPAVGIASCSTLDVGGHAASIPAAERWILRLDDDATARAAGFRGPLVSGQHPGRLRVGSSGLEAQIAVGAAGLAALPSRPHPNGPADLLVLPAHVDSSGLRASHVVTDGGRPVRHLVVAVASDGLESTPLCVPDGDHIFIGGGARTGVTTALDHVAGAWMACEPQGVVHRWGGSPSEIRARLLGQRTPASLLIVDDADRVHDTDGLFAEIIRGAHPHVTIALGARLDAVRSAYGHWTRDVGRSRCGLVMTGPGEIDGDLLGAVLPRRTAIAHRPGLAWLIDVNGHRLVQVAGRMRT